MQKCEVLKNLSSDASHRALVSPSTFDTLYNLKASSLNRLAEEKIRCFSPQSEVSKLLEIIDQHKVLKSMYYDRVKKLQKESIESNLDKRDDDATFHFEDEEILGTDDESAEPQNPVHSANLSDISEALEKLQASLDTEVQALLSRSLCSLAESTP